VGIPEPENVRRLQFETPATCVQYNRYSSKEHPPTMPDTGHKSPVHCRLRSRRSRRSEESRALCTAVSWPARWL